MFLSVCISMRGLRVAGKVTSTFRSSQYSDVYRIGRDRDRYNAAVLPLGTKGRRSLLPVSQDVPVGGGAGPGAPPVLLSSSDVSVRCSTACDRVGSTNLPPSLTDACKGAQSRSRAHHGATAPQQRHRSRLMTASNAPPPAIGAALWITRWPRQSQILGVNRATPLYLRRIAHKGETSV